MTSKRESGSADKPMAANLQSESENTISSGQKSPTRINLIIARIFVGLAAVCAGLGVWHVVELNPRDAALSFAIATICIMGATNSIAVCSHRNNK